MRSPVASVSAAALEMVKHEDVRGFLWLAQTVEGDQINPVRRIKNDIAPDSGE
ncbi:hypothetical protein [Streptomyces sirii]|uniref:hypothetical protein n=1 Tax=Streptomyces sirii TaxID=3127701 RepID=UPI003D36F363